MPVAAGLGMVVPAGVSYYRITSQALRTASTRHHKNAVNGAVAGVFSGLPSNFSQDYCHLNDRSADIQASGPPISSWDSSRIVHLRCCATCADLTERQTYPKFSVMVIVPVLRFRNGPLDPVGCSPKGILRAYLPNKKGCCRHGDN
jgi:hypothetical protein